MNNLCNIAAIDHHAHNLLKPEAAARYDYAAAFTEGHDPDIVNNHARHTLFYLRSLREIAQLFDCEPTEMAILERRQQLGLEAVTQRCFEAANLEAIFLDDGFLANDVLPWTWHRQFVGVKRVVRLEYLAQELIAQSDNFTAFLERFRSEIEPTSSVVALKSIAAYRTGLDIEITPLEVARSRFADLKRNQMRLADKPFIDFLVTQALDIAAKHRLPIQFHTGFGDPDLDLRLGNPLYLRRILEEKRWRNAPIVLLHASYPYTAEAGYLASVYPQVYLDCGLAVPFLSVAGMRSTVQQLLELAPTTKLMYSSDAHNIPELYYLGAKWGREVLAWCLEAAIANSDLTAAEAQSVATNFLSENSKRLYQRYQT